MIVFKISSLPTNKQELHQIMKWTISNGLLFIYILWNFKTHKKTKQKWKCFNDTLNTWPVCVNINILIG